MSRRPASPPLAGIRQLALLGKRPIPPEWEDMNGHMNVQYYLRLYEHDSYRIFEPFGIDEPWLFAHDSGLFDLANHLLYYAEVLIGDTVSTYNRLLALRDRRFHGMFFIVNDTRNRLACTVEYLTAGVSLAKRRTSPFSPELDQALKSMQREHAALPWPVTPCGAISI